MDDKRDLHVKYRRGKQVVGSTSMSQIDNNQSYVTSFDDINSATNFFTEYKNKTIPSFGNIILLHVAEHAVLVDKGFEFFDQTKTWEFHIWYYDSRQTKIISMSYAFVKLFKGVITGLQVLHSHNWYHGRLLEGITVSKNLDVKLFNVSKQDCYTTADGIEKDLHDLRKLVKMVIKKNPPGQGYEVPDCVTLFLKFNRLFNTINLDASINVAKSKFHAYFLFNNPIFAYPNDRLVLIYKFINLRSLCTNEVDSAFINTMGKWWLRLEPLSYLHDRLSFGMDLYMAPTKKKISKSIIAFYQACLRHKFEQVPQSHDIDEVVVESELLEAFPDCLPKLYYNFVRLLAWQKIPKNRRYDSYIEFFKKAYPMLAA